MSTISVAELRYDIGSPSPIETVELESDCGRSTQSGRRAKGAPIFASAAEYGNAGGEVLCESEQLRNERPPQENYRQM
jgi:hypothetical protein